MSHNKTRNRRPDVTLSQLVATSMAAITAAFLGSRLGTAGTITGAGLASVVSTSAGAVYQHSIDRTRARFRPADRQRAAASDATASDAAATSDPEPIPMRPARRWRPNWKVAAGVAVVAFAVGMVAVTAVELVHGGPLSGGNTGTTVGSLFGQTTEHRPPPAPKSTTSPPPPASTAPTTTTPETTAPTTTPTVPTTTSTPGSPTPSAAQPSVTTAPTTG